MGLQEKTESEFETCACGCGKLTSVKKNTPAEMRGETYVREVGQFSYKCFNRIYGPSKTEEARIIMQLNDLGILI